MPAGDPPSYDSGTFTAVYHSTGEDYVALATLNGVSGTVSPSRGSSFGISFGQATFAKTTTSTNHPDQESGVYDYVYARTGPKTAVLFQYSLLSPSDIPNIIGLDFASSGSANWTNYTLSVAGSISFSTVPQSGYFAPAALTDVTAKSTSGGESETNLLFYGSFTSGGGSSYGTYTYAPFSPTGGDARPNLHRSRRCGRVGIYSVEFQQSGQRQVLRHQAERQFRHDRNFYRHFQITREAKSFDFRCN